MQELQVTKAILDALSVHVPNIANVLQLAGCTTVLLELPPPASVARPSGLHGPRRFIVHFPGVAPEASIYFDRSLYNVYAVKVLEGTPASNGLVAS